MRAQGSAVLLRTAEPGGLRQTILCRQEGRDSYFLCTKSIFHRLARRASRRFACSPGFGAIALALARRSGNCFGLSKAQRQLFWP